SDLSLSDVHNVLEMARAFLPVFTSPDSMNTAPSKCFPLLQGQVVANVFFEDSTRTRSSFELAARYLGAEVVNFSVQTSSVKKGETLLDTAKTLQAMGVNALVIRHPQSGSCQVLSRQISPSGLSILNAGDGRHDHPSQGLLDLFTLQDSFAQNQLGSIKGKKIAIVGDIAHSRVARTNLIFLNLMGAELHVVGPQTLLPESVASLGCQVHTHLPSALTGADAVICLRLQLERQKSGFIPSLGEYTKLFGINHERLKKYCKPHVKVLHPGPMNREVEITSAVADDLSLSLVTQQVTHGVAVRMALLYLTLTDSSQRQDISVQPLTGDFTYVS
ncbi:MAG: aspartate carbamoyltransferase catalytic subunit, partial [Cyanobacteria bacterium]|nr:aspartate carbamoyltransferase catalytic subunit [Cyanobacteriota bacterium]